MLYNIIYKKKFLMSNNSKLYKNIFRINKYKFINFFKRVVDTLSGADTVHVKLFNLHKIGK